jgi:site-specific DNA-cytosine methylase
VINLELFSCAGGMAEGFRRAGLTFDLAVDFAPDHCDSYERNLGHRPVAMDVRDMLRLVRAELLRLDVDLLVADPPCTPWSRAGKRLGTADERDMLEVTCDLIAALRPRRYLIGNVPGLDDSKHLPTVQRLIGGLSRYGYCTADFARLDAADYGVPQHRVRPFWFGHREGPCVRWTSPTHCDPVELATLAVPGVAPLRPWVTCRDALGHLEPDHLGRPVKMRKRTDHGKQKGSIAERPARTVGTSNLSDGNVIAVRRSRHDEPVHTSNIDEPARAVTTQCRAPGHATTVVLNGKHAPSGPDEPARTIGAKSRGNGGCAVLSMEPHHPPSHVDEPMTIRAGSGGGANRAMLLEGEPARRKRRPSTKGPQSTRTIGADTPSTTVQARTDRVGSGSPVLEWPWTRPATTVTARPGLAPPGHHDEAFAIMSLPDAIILSERAAALLQGFPDGWAFCGKTKKARWSQIGQAMPPALAEAVARAIVEQDRQADLEAIHERERLRLVALGDG